MLQKLKHVVELMEEQCKKHQEHYEIIKYTSTD